MMSHPKNYLTYSSCICSCRQPEPTFIFHGFSSSLFVFVTYALSVNCQWICKIRNHYHLHRINTSSAKACVCNGLLSSTASFPWPCCMSYVAWQLGKYFTHGGTMKDSRVRWCIVLEGNLMGCSLSFIGKDLVKQSIVTVMYVQYLKPHACFPYIWDFTEASFAVFANETTSLLLSPPVGSAAPPGEHT